MAINYDKFVEKDGSVTIPSGINLKKRLELLEVGAAEALRSPYGCRAFKNIQKKIGTTELSLEIEKMELKEKRYKQAENATNNIIYLMSVDNSPKNVPSKR